MSLDKTKFKFSNVRYLSEKLSLGDDAADFHFAFKVNDEETLVPAHKIILALQSPVFHSMFFGNSKETSKNKIYINNASVNAFKEFLMLFYSENLVLTRDYIYEFTTLASEYKMQRFLEFCEKYLMNHTNNNCVCTHLELAIKCNLRILEMHCMIEIQKEAMVVFKSNDFITTKIEMLRMILHFDNLNCFEIDIFDACMSWAENACKQNGVDTTDRKNLRDALKDCFYLIPIIAMNIEDFSRVLSSNQSMFTIQEVSDIMAYIVSGASTEYTNEFACSTNKIPKFNWNHGLFIFDQDASLKQIRLCVKKHTTFYSNNRKLLLGGFRVFGFEKKESSEPLLGTIRITAGPQNRLLRKIQFVSNSNDSETILFKLENPLIIKPYMEYTIHIDFSENVLDNEKYVESWKCSGSGFGSIRSVAQSNMYISIKSTDDEEANSGNFNCPRGSIIAKFFFNRI